VYRLIRPPDLESYNEHDWRGARRHPAEGLWLERIAGKLEAEGCAPRARRCVVIPSKSDMATRAQRLRC